MIARARKFAVEAHGNQMYGLHPYVVHLDDVADITKPYGEQAQVVAYLHDVIEDTKTTKSDIEQIFGSFIARCVQILSDEQGETRKLRKTETYKKMASIDGKETLALLVKAADRLANMRACLKDGNHKLMKMYKSESIAFKRAVFRKGLCNDIWLDIDAIQHATSTCKKSRSQ